MAQTIDVTNRFVFKDGSDKRPMSFSLSDKTVTEAFWQRIAIASGTASVANTSQIRLGAVAETGNRLLYIKSDKVVRVQFLTATASTPLIDHTTVAGWGVDLVSNGFMAAYQTAGVTTLWITNAGTLATTDLATVEVAIYEV